MSFSEYRAGGMKTKPSKDSPRPNGWYTEDDGTVLYIENGVVLYEHMDWSKGPEDTIKAQWNKHVKPIVEGYKNWTAKSAIKFEANKRIFQDKLQTLAEQHAINQQVHDEKYKSKSSRYKIQWRPDIGEYMSDYDYNIYLLKKARMGNE